MTVPQISPNPPVKVVPPMTTEATESISDPIPKSGMAVIMRAEMNIAVSDAQKPENMYTPICVRSVSIPESWAATGLAPVAYMFVPLRVLFRNNWVRKASAINTMVTI